MNELYEEVVKTAKGRLRKEQETNITGETLKLISLAIEMYPWVKPSQSDS